MAFTRYIAPVIIAAALFISPVLADSSCCTPCVQPENYYSKSFFSGIKIWEVGKPAKEIFFLNHRLNEREENCWGGALQIAGYGGQSVNSNDLAQYFLPYGKCCLYVTEYKTVDGDPVDGSTLDGGAQQIEARNFNIATAGVSGTYTGTVCFAPQETVAGIGFTWKQTLWQDCDLDPMLWMEVNFPVEYRKHTMGLCEKTTSTLASDGAVGLSGATHVANMTQAFAQSAMLYGRIDNSCENMSKWGVADIEIRFGYNSIKGDCCDMNGYLGFVAPTGTKINAETMQNMFPVVIGNNHHWGLMFGSHLGYDLFERGNHMIRYELDMCSKWLFANTQTRSFDLVQQGNWSRFLELYSGLDQATAAFDASSMNIGTFGINLLTRCVKVEPRFNTNVNTAFLYNYKNWEFDLGYNLYVRQAERIEMCSFPDGISVKDINGDGQTNIARTIKNNFPAEAISLQSYALHTLQICDIDLNSAAAPAVLSNTVYAGVDYNFNCWCMPGFVGVSGLYEFSLANASSDRWIVVGKVGFSY